MTAHSERRRVPYSPQQMFDLVADVGSYPEFIPWISGSRIRKKSKADNGGEVFEADLVISFKVFRHPATSADAVARIDVEAISGPFNKLLTRYAFHPTGDGACDMTFEVDFAFRNRLMQRAAGAAFDLAMRKIAGAFEERAKVLYGTSS